jgi:hypothetical protein
LAKEHRMSMVPPDTLRRECEYRLRVLEPGFEAREVIPPGSFLYDPILGWVEDDGALYFSDHGPQRDVTTWVPYAVHGTIHRLTRSGEPSRLIEPGAVPGMPYLIRRAPEWFGKWEGDIFFPGQAKGGREGALSGHRLYRLHEGDAEPAVFVDIPHAGSTGGGTPGAMMIGGFGRKDTPHEGLYICQTMMNCVIYQITPDAECTPLIITEDVFGKPVMPYFVFYAPAVWGPELEGKLLLAGLAGSSFEDDEPGDNVLDYWVIDGDTIDTEPVASRDIGWAMAEEAPSEFGPYGGHTFLFDFGATNLMHVSKPEPGPLPYDSKILRVDPAGNVSVFAEGMQGGWNELRFDRERMYISCLRRSYSTGEYHEPDGSLYEIRAVS